MEGQAVLWRQATEGLGHVYAADRSFLHADRAPWGRWQPDCEPPPSTPDGSALVRDNCEEPRLNLSCLSQLWQLPPGSKRSFLDGVFGLCRVAQQYQGQAVGSLNEGTEQGIERLSAARQSLLDQLDVAHSGRRVG